MKERIKLSIDQPCAEKFENFTPTEIGGFCSACEKEVVDFSKMDKLAIQDYFSNASDKTCGRFEVGQMDRFNYVPAIKHKRSRFAYLGALSFTLLGLLSTQNSIAQNKMIVAMQESPIDNGIEDGEKEEGFILKGNVSYNSEPLPFVSIYLQGSDIAITSDFDGNFTFPKHLNAGDTLILSYIGFKPIHYVVSESDSMIVNFEMPQVECYIAGEVSVEKVYEPRASLWQKIRSLF